MTEPATKDARPPWVNADGRVMERLELHLTYTCPERCAFCSEEHRMASYRAFPVTWARAATVLRTHASRGVRAVHFTGGEPTIHPDFVELLVLAKKLAMRTSVGTIGTMLANEDFARRAVPHLDEALFSLHGPTAEVHDAMTRTRGSFERVTRAITQSIAIRPDFRAYVNTVVTRHNVDALPETVALCGKLGAQLIVISNTTPEGAGYDAYAELAVPLAKLREILPTVPARAPGAVVRFFGVPMCLLGEHAMLSNDLHWDPRVTVEWASAPGKVVFDGIYSWTPDRKRVHVAACDGCSRKGVCMGVFDRYAELWPTGELTPIG
jgi:MoaA/NifB/PqqE/SkfB family radical SAM enzyme